MFLALRYAYNIAKIFNKLVFSKFHLDKNVTFLD